MTVRARKRFGQHFLEPAWVDKVIRAIDPRPDETFLEIGPGRGALTRPLAARAKAVIACEIDRDLAAELREAMPKNVAIIEGDFLTSTIDVEELAAARSAACRVRVAGNLPYNVASPILFRLLEINTGSVATRGGPLLTDATLMLQREVADRLAAAPGSRDYGVLTVLVGHRAAVRRRLTLPPGAFRPQPKVHSAVVRLEFHGPQPPVVDEQVFADLVQAVFTRRRKTLANALAAYRPASRDAGGTERVRPQDTVRRVLAAAGIDGSRRPETLTIAEFGRLADVLTAHSR
jgi:16S rRNA (adenine1518-N6/adenine1519-N6)-dimethyltransferase